MATWRGLLLRLRILRWLLLSALLRLSVLPLWRLRRLLILLRIMIALLPAIRRRLRCRVPLMWIGVTLRRLLRIPASRLRLGILRRLPPTARLLRLWRGLISLRTRFGITCWVARRPAWVRDTL